MLGKEWKSLKKSEKWRTKTSKHATKIDFGYVTTYPMSPRDRLKRILKKKKGRVRIYKRGTYASKRNGKLEK